MALLFCTIIGAVSAVSVDAIAKDARATDTIGASGGNCGAGVFVGLGVSPTYQDAKDAFVSYCQTGTNAHPVLLCEQGAEELFEDYDMAAAFTEDTDGPFCQSVRSVLEAHEEWVAAHTQTLMLHRTQGKRTLPGSLDASATSKAPGNIEAAQDPPGTFSSCVETGTFLQTMTPSCPGGTMECRCTRVATGHQENTCCQQGR